MQRISLYPFNKITQGLVRFQDLLPFKIENVIDFNFNIGKDAGEQTCGVFMNIKIFDDIVTALEKTDTLILNDPGTPFWTFEEFYIENRLQERWKYLVKYASENKKRIISTHKITDFGLQSWLNESRIEIEEHNISKDYLNEKIRYYLNNPSNDEKICKIGIYGTSSAIGKFTAQMSLYRELRKVRETQLLISEPTAFLFGMPQADVCLPPIPLGYYIRAIIRESFLDNHKYIIFSDQSSLSDNGNMEWVATKFAVLKAVNPDIVILVVGYDDNSNIRDCLDIIRIYTDSKLIVLLLPDRVQVEYGKYSIISKYEIEKRKNELREMFKIETIEAISDIGKIMGQILEI